MSTASKKKTTKVLLCGGGNAVHVLASYVGALDDCEVNILSLYPGEAKRLREAIPKEGIKCINDLGDDVYGRPTLVSDDPAEVTADGVDLVLLALPSFTHEMYLRALKPYLKQPGIMIGAMPGEGGFDLCARHVLGVDFVNTAANLFALETLPWACRIMEYGKVVKVLGTKLEINVVVKTADGCSEKPVVDLLQRVVGRMPILRSGSNFLAITLMNPNSLAHPTISYGFYRNRDTTMPLDEPPLFYQGTDEDTGELMMQVSHEVIEVGRVLMERYPNLDLSSVRPVDEWIIRSYGDDITDKSSIAKMLLTNKGFNGLKHPMRTIQVEGQTKYLPDFNNRYFSEDLPCGLIVTRGIAELAGVPTPHMDEIIMWCQTKMGKEFLVNGRLIGKDLDSTRCPQHYGCNDLDSFIVMAQ